MSKLLVEIEQRPFLDLPETAEPGSNYGQRCTVIDSINAPLPRHAVAAVRSARGGELGITRFY